MTTMLRRMVMMCAVIGCAVPAFAQTADEIIEKHLAATGGRQTLAKITSRVMTGTVVLTTPVGEISGPLEVYAKAPNKSRTLIKLDISALGGGSVTSDQRFDGTTGYLIDTFNGNREITGAQLQAMRNGWFPSALLNYREHGVTVALAGQEKIGAKDAFVMVVTPKEGPVTRMFIDADSFMIVKTVTPLNVPPIGDIEQTVELSDYRDVDGVKVPFAVRTSNAAQAVRATISDVKQNTPIDDSMFVRPAGQ